MNLKTPVDGGRVREAAPGSIPPEYRLETYDYTLPPELIAQEPLPEREDSRLMVFRRGAGRAEHRRFSDIPSLLEPSDMVVINETRVIPALLTGQKKTGGRVELLVLDPAPHVAPPVQTASTRRQCLVRSSKPLRPGAELEIQEGFTVIAEETISRGRVNIRFPVAEHDFLRFLDANGKAPLPPYIRLESREENRDRARYQTVYASTPGSVAAPTAGLHFTDRILEALQRRGIEIVRILLHVGPGTFTPVREEDIRRHSMEAESCSIPEDGAARIARAMAENRRIIAVGTTTVRALESAATEDGSVRCFSGRSDLFIYPGYRFKVVKGMITNFHLPRSTLLMLVCAFAGTDNALVAYQDAVARRYRFFSYGDACLILD